MSQKHKTPKLEKMCAICKSKLNFHFNSSDVFQNYMLKFLLVVTLSNGKRKEKTIEILLNIFHFFSNFGKRV